MSNSSQTSAPIVALTNCPDYNSDHITDAVTRQFELLQGLQNFIRPGDSVLLKPNFIAPRSRRYATQTHPAVILAVAKLLKDFGAKPFVADSPAWGNIFTCAKKLKLTEPLKKLGVPLKQLNKPKWCKLADFNIGISSVALDADKIINLPKFKTHQQLVTTFAVKNMFGCVAGKQKAAWHFIKGKDEETFCKFLIEIYKFLNPALTIIDAVNAMDGPGPIRGRTRPLQWLIAGTEPISCETICSKLINSEPLDIPIIKTAKKIGFGCCDLSKIKVVGDSFANNICTDFQFPPPIPIRFSPIRVFKSFCRQIWMLSKSAFSGHD